MNDALRNYLLGMQLSLDEECLLFGGLTSQQEIQSQADSPSCYLSSSGASEMELLKSQLESSLQNLSNLGTENSNSMIKNLQLELARSQSVMNEQKLEISNLQNKLQKVA